MKLRFLLALVLLFPAVPGVTLPVFAGEPPRPAPAARVIMHSHIFEIGSHTFGDTKVVAAIVGGKIVYEAGAK